MTKLDEQGKIKKLQTNVKSAQSTYALAGVLALIYMARYFITGNFNFYFSSYIIEFLLKISAPEITVNPLISANTAYILIGVYIAVYVLSGVVMLKFNKLLALCLGIYAVDFILLIAGTASGIFGSFSEDIFIDIIVHIFVTAFLAVGTYSAFRLSKTKTAE